MKPGLRRDPERLFPISFASRKFSREPTDATDATDASGSQFLDGVPSWQEHNIHGPSAAGFAFDDVNRLNGFQVSDECERNLVGN